jgi:uncharacterized protein
MRLSFGTQGMSARRNPSPDHVVGMQGVPTDVLPLPSCSAQVRALLGLHLDHPFYRDSAFRWLVALGPITWLAIIWFLAFQPLPWHVIWSAAFLSVALWQPLFEELLFRGVIQGQLLQPMWGRKTWIGLSLANLLTSLLFTLAHLASHSVSWSLLVFIPSLCFGFMRNRFGSVYPAIVLHAFYNAGYFLLTGGATLLNSR